MNNAIIQQYVTFEIQSFSFCNVILQLYVAKTVGLA